MRALLLTICVLMLAGCNSQNKNSNMITASNYQLDTIVTINIYNESDEQLLQDSFNEIDRLDKILSVHSEGSDLDVLQKESGGEFVTVSPETYFAFKESVKYSEKTGGLFDVTIGPLVSLWNIKDGAGHIPNNDELAQTLPLINYKKIEFSDDSKIRLSEKGMSPDFGAIAKGYIADKVKGFLIEKGVTSAIINLGGNVVLIGEKPDGGPFKVGIRDPDGNSGDFLGIVAIKDKSLVSSGIYERFFEREGKTYHHILNPKTGFPSETELCQVTIISDKSIDGDVLSTSALLLGLNGGMELIESIPDVDAIFVTKDNLVYATSEIKKSLSITNDAYTMAEFPS